MIKKIRVSLKLFLIIAAVIIFLLSTFFVDILFREKKQKLTFCTKITSFLSGFVLFVMGINVRTDRSEAGLKSFKNFLIVSNHLSYLDTLIISSKINSVFVASVDGHQTKFPIGLITKKSGGIFVERKKRTKVKDDMQKIVDALKAGFNVVLFPEGTTSDGSALLPFRTSFFYSANAKEVKILPLCINYQKVDGVDISNSNKHLIFFFEEIGFTDHFLRLLSLKEIKVNLRFESVVHPDRLSSRKDLAEIVYEKIKAVYEPKNS